MTAHARFDFSTLDTATMEKLRFDGAERYPDDRLTLLIARDFISPQECALFVQMIDRDCSPSRLAYAGVDPSFRTSETCYFADTLPIIEVLELRLSLFFGIHSKHGERVQGQRYLEGQEFKAHSDYFPEDHAGYKKHCGKSGNRTWTGMIYLNEPEGGGETLFPHLERAFVPRTGMLLAWNNLTPEGRGNPITTHHGLPVTAGRKYVLTKWYRERVFVQ